MLNVVHEESEANATGGSTGSSSLLDQIATQYTQQAHFWAFRGAWALFLNTRVPPFDDVRVRRALAFAIDRKQVAQVYRVREFLTGQLLATFLDLLTLAILLPFLFWPTRPWPGS